LDRSAEKKRSTADPAEKAEVEGIKVPLVGVTG